MTHRMTQTLRKQQGSNLHFAAYVQSPVLVSVPSLMVNVLPEPAVSFSSMLRDLSHFLVCCPVQMDAFLFSRAICYVKQSLPELSCD